MGKKQGQAQRTKGNVQPSSSANAALLLEQANFNNYPSDLGVASGITFLEDALDINMDNDFRLVFRKITKKDSLTKQKGLEEYKILIETKSVESCVSIISYWAKLYTKLSVDNDRKIREITQQTNEKFCLKVTKNLAPHLKTIVPYWVYAQCDPYSSASLKAQAAFKAVFSEAKQPEVINFAKNEILHVIYENLIVETSKTLSDPKTAEDEALQKYETIISMSFNALNFLFNYLNEQNVNEINDKLEKLFNDQKFWRFSKEKSSKIKSSFYYLLFTLVDKLPGNLGEKFKVKMIPLVFYACDEDDYSSSTIIWQAILKCVTNYPECWSLVNIKKAFLPKLYALLRKYNANLNREEMYSTVLQLVKSMPLNLVEDKGFYNEIMLKMSDGLKETRSKLACSSLNKQVECYFECLLFILEKCNSTEDAAYCTSLIDSCVISLIADCIDVQLTVQSSYFNILTVQIEKLSLFLNSYEKLSSYFWLKISNLMIQDENFVDKDKEEKIVDCFIGLFKKFNVDRVANFEDLVSKLVKKLFANYERSQDGTIIKYLSYISLNFMNERLIDVFIEQQPTNEMLNVDRSRKLKLFNSKFQGLLDACEVEENYFNLANLSIIINLKIGSNSDNFLDYFIKSSTDLYKFLNYMFMNEDSLVLSATSSQNIKQSFQKALFSNFRVYEYLIDSFFKTDRRFFLYFTTKSESGLELSSLNSFVKYLVQYNEDLADDEQSNALLRSINEEIVENLKSVLKIILQNPNSKSINKFLTFCKSYLNLKHEQSGFKNLWSFMFDLINLEISLTETELYVGVQDVCRLCVRLLSIENSSDLNNYLASSFEADKINIIDVVFKLIEYLKTRNEDLNAFLISLLNSQLNSQEIYENLCGLCLPSMYLRAYTETDDLMLLSSEFDALATDDDEPKFNSLEKASLLKRLNFGLKLLNKYGIRLNNEFDFYYLTSNCLILKYYNFYNKSEMAYLSSIEKELEIYILNHSLENRLNIDEKHAEINFLFISHLMYVYKNNSKIESIKQLYSQFITKNDDDLHYQHILKGIFYDYHFLVSDQVYKFEQEIEYVEEIQAKILSLNDLLTTNTNKYLAELIFNLNLLIKYTKLMLDSSILNNLKNIVPILSKILDNMIDLKISEVFSSNENWLKIHLNDKFNKFLKLYFTQTSKLESQQLSSHLTAKQWDFISLYLAKVAQIQTKGTFSTHQHTQFIFTSYYDLLFHYIKCMQINIEEMSKFYPKNLSSEWNGFFSKEIFDPLLVFYVKVANFLVEKKENNKAYLSFQELNALSKLSATISLIPVVRLNFNELEINLNAKDHAILNNSTLKSAFNLNDKLQTIVNTLYPLLSHPYRQIQMSSFLILDKLMVNLSDYYKISEADEATNSDDTNILKLLPNVIQESLFSNVKMISKMKNEFDFEESLVEELEAELGNNKNLVAYLYTSKLLLNLLSTDTNLEFKFKLISNLREHKFDDYLINCLYRSMPKNPIVSQNLNLFDYSPRNALCNDEWNLFTKTDFDFNSFYIEKFSCDLYKHALKLIPALIRDWWNRQGKRISDYVDRFTSKYVSPVLIANEMKQINSNSNSNISSTNTSATNVDDEYESMIKIKGSEKTREVVTVYKVKDLTMELVLRLPYDYPLGVIDVSCTKRLGVSENEWRNWLLQLTTYLTHQNGDIVESLKIWKRNVDKKFNGVEECTICYSVIHGTNYQLPKMKCRTCRKKFHSSCLYKWFESSNNSTCPLCRNLF